ncbi:hypothetical protein RN001_014198 [Aquatica leii]|uniref:Uncharacterized protein n=1 Tax=Aquatica leii TaxID=1421715 RepID=A0AAN7P3V0_9COLE|nr:hypothetical protein RN001_014198 [Aquatica leii]
MNHIDTVFESSSREILSLTRKLVNFKLQEKLLGSYRVKNYTKEPTKQKENEHFKRHPNILTSSGSDTSGKTSTVRNGYQKYEPVLHNCNEQICNVEYNEIESYASSPRHTETSLDESSTEVEEFVNSPTVNFILKNGTYSNRMIKLKNKVKDSIDSKLEVESIQRRIPKRLADKKLFHFMQRSLTCLEDISLSLSNKIVLPDGEEDWQRRRVRNLEFSSRFQRNYLYQLGRQIIELQKSIRMPHHTKSVVQCVITAHQSMLQAFLAYNSHIPTCLGNVVLDKLKLMIDHAKHLLSIHSRLLVSGDLEASRKQNLIQSISGRCDAVLEKGTEIMTKSTELVAPKKSAIKSSRSTNKLSSKNNLRKRIESKLSMYSMPATVKKRDAWKRAYDTVSNDKFKNSHVVQSRYKTAGFKHRPPLEKNKTNAQTKTKLFQKKSVTNLKDTPLASPKNEDNIKTMIAMIKEEEERQRKEKCRRPLLAGLECVLPLLKSICEKLIANGDEVMQQEQFENMLRTLMDMALQGTINKENVNHYLGTNGEVQKNSFNLSYKSLPNLIHKVDSKILNGKVQSENGKQHSENSDIEVYLPSDVTVEKKRGTVRIHQRSDTWKTVSVTGEKNAQLICIRDDCLTPEVLFKEPNPSLVTITRASTVEDDSDMDQKTKKAPIQKLHTVKISRLPKSMLRTIAPLRKSEIKSILQGKLQQIRYMQGIPMYCKTSKRHPWQIVDQIAENLLNEILLTLVQEIQVNGILQNLYNSEFQ